jgi:phosphomannomutase
MTRKNRKILVGRDTRTSGEALKHAVISGLLSQGCDIVDAGVLPTPSCQLAVEEFEADGGVIITASHNPGQWNGLKFVNARGEFLNEHDFKSLVDILDSDKIAYPAMESSGTYKMEASVNERIVRSHISHICSVINVDRIRKNKFKAVIDACNGAGSRLILPLLKELGVETVQLNCDESGIFPRGAEPLPENLGMLCDTVKKVKADIGFAVDPDADRLSIVSEQGAALGEEMTLPLVASHVITGQSGVIVTNLSTSMAIDYVAKKHDVPVIRTKIGEANVVSAMKEHQCIIGGEGNGGVIFPEIHFARDSGIGIGLILDYLSEAVRPISDLANDIPKYEMIKKKVDCSAEVIRKTLDHYKTRYSEEQMDERDGLKIIWEDAWLHMRKSGTEGLLRIFAEATDRHKATELVESALDQVSEFKKEIE